MTTSGNGVDGDAQGAEAPDHEHDDRRNLERRATGRIDGRAPGFNAPAGDEPASRVHRLHGSGDRDGWGDDGDHPPVPAAASYQQVAAEFTLRQSPWLPPDELKAYYEVDPDFARGIIETIQSAQQARIDAELIPIRAEAWALKVATVGVTFLPWIAAGLAGMFAILGHDTAAIISGLFSAATGGAQILHAVRRPPRTVVAQAAPAEQPARPKPSQAGKGKGGRAAKKKRGKR